MTENSKLKLKSGHGGARPGAGRPKAFMISPAQEARLADALDELDAALLDLDPDGLWNPAKRRMRIVFDMLGVDAETQASALLVPDTSLRFLADVEAALARVRQASQRK